jgi:ribosomal protein S18 acetylase RimI-like enzyme
VRRSARSAQNENKILVLPRITIMSLEIRKAAESDLPAVLRLYAQPGMDNGRVLNVDAAAKILRRMGTYPEYAVYLAAADDGSVVGTFALLVMDNLAHMGTPSAVVEDVCVDEQFRGQGIGRAMMDFAMELARQHGCYKLALSSNAAREGAHAFYRSLGFEQHGLSFHVALR